MNNTLKQVTESLTNSEEWSNLISPNSLWSQDPLFRDYHKVGQKQKGVAGEYFAERYMKALGSEVSKPTNTDHDRIIDGYKTEIKFSLANSDNKNNKIVYNRFMINHVATSKDWDRLLFVGINPDLRWDNVTIKEGVTPSRVVAYYMEKKDFVRYMKSPGMKVFKHQQSGAKGGNDDYICTNVAAFISLPFVKEVSQW